MPVPLEMQRSIEGKHHERIRALKKGKSKKAKTAEARRFTAEAQRPQRNINNH